MNSAELKLPTGWDRSNLKELCQINPKHDHQIDDSVKVSFVPMAAVSEVLGQITAPEVKTLREVRKGYTHFADGDVVFAKITPCMENGKAASVRGLVNGLACGTTEFFVLRPRGAVDQDYLFYFIRQESYRKAARAMMQSGVGQARVPKEFIENTELPLPPLVEQRRIVSKIEALQERSRIAREALVEVGPLLEQFRQSLLAAAFRGDLTADWRAANPNVEPASELLNRIRQKRREKWEYAELAKYKAKGKQPPKGWEGKYKEPALTTETDPFELPMGWCWTEIEAVSDWVKDGTHWPPKTTNHGIPFIGIRNVIDGRIDWTTIDRWVSEETYAELTASFPHRSGDVLYTAVGATFGRAFPIEDNRKFIFQRHIAHIRPLSGVCADYIIYGLNSPNGFGQAKRVARGAAQPTVTLGDLKRIRIPLCSNEEQQEIVKRIVDAISAMDSIREAVAESKSALTQLDQSIFAKAFRGELVPQDPSDEPASVLLERIRSARAKAESNGKPRASHPLAKRGSVR